MGRKRKYTLNEDYFNVINTPMKAYLIGFIYADGGIYNNYLTIGIHKRDVKVLDKIKDELGYGGPLYYDKTNTYVKLTISSSKIVKDLFTLGVIPNKTYISKDIPKIKDEYFHHFLLGFFDGDGSIYRASVKSNDYTVNFTNNKDVLSIIKYRLNKLGISSGKIRKRWDNNISCMLDIRGSLNIEQMRDLLYKNPPPFYFKRKKEKFDNFTNSLSQLSKRKLKKNEILKIKELYLLGITQKEISEILEMPYPTIKSVIQRLRKSGDLNS